MTTRRYPRSLAEAYPAERASCIETPDGRLTGYVLGGSFPASRRVAGRIRPLTFRQRISRWWRRVGFSWGLR